MRSVGIKVLKDKLSEYVRLAAEGETVLITDRDRVVAELVPPERTRTPVVADAVLAEMVRSGLMTPALRAPGRPPRRVPSAATERLLRELEEDREDR